MVRVIQESAQRRRHSRRPNFPVAGTVQPYGLYPVWAHPVLPGETMQSASLKLRALSMPVKHPLAGAWLESWIVYVKFTDLDPELGQMFISDAYSETGYTAAADSPRYFAKAGQIDWLRLCTERVHEAYFLNEGETPRYIDGVPQVKLNNVSWYQNMIFQAADEVVPTGDATEMYQHLQGWQMLQQMQMTELTYEQYLEQYGAKPVAERSGDPEILRFSRSWTQPSNTISPADGSPSSAFAWNDEVKLDKAKRFNEPGFVVHLMAIRPKMYQANLAASMIGNLWGFSDFFPAYTLDDPTASVRELAKTDPVFGAAMTDAGGETMLYDHMDLLSHGEQFVNDWTNQPYELPKATGWSVLTGADTPDVRGEYCTPADVTALFKGTAAPYQQCYYEGMASAVVSGHAQDTTR